MGTYANYEITISGNPIQAKLVFDAIYRQGSDYVDYNDAVIHNTNDRYIITVCQKTSWLGDWGFTELSSYFPDVTIVEKAFCDDCMFFGYIKTYNAGEVVEEEIPLLFKNFISVTCDVDSLDNNMSALLYNIQDNFDYSNIVVQDDVVIVYTKDEPFFPINNDSYAPSNLLANCYVACSWELETDGKLWNAYGDNENEF